MVKFIKNLSRALNVAAVFTVFIMPCAYLLTAYMLMKRIKHFCIGRNEYSVDY